MNSFYKNIMLFILVQAIAMTPLITSSSSEPTKGYDDNNNDSFSLRTTWHVHTVNDLSDDKILFVHCKSKDDDLGIHNLTVGVEFSWKFKLQIFGGTLFWCYMAYDNFHAAFNVFWVNEVFLQDPPDEGGHDESMEMLPRKTIVFQGNAFKLGGGRESRYG
ncbi:hypothetical protein J1N35_009850 [Gossypium stocksii]|uniref:S-protein homolog n=1 Tax=Gossypium stocksii TaxID=47602 RepID=A0A9D3W020_9ROSI|nr:hypothetical protein J1N35_009850 [Gossypium stocksii]